MRYDDAGSFRAGQHRKNKREKITKKRQTTPPPPPPNQQSHQQPQKCQKRQGYGSQTLPPPTPSEEKRHVRTHTKVNTTPVVCLSPLRQDKASTRDPIPNTDANGRRRPTSTNDAPRSVCGGMYVYHLKTCDECRQIISPRLKSMLTVHAYGTGISYTAYLKDAGGR